MKKTTWIVVPAYNEETYLARFLTKLLQVSSQVIIVNDGSSDSTQAVAEQFGVHVLRHEVNVGKGAALRTGCEYAFNHLQADAVIIMDGDDQHDPADVPLFYQALEQGHQVVFGVRAEAENMPWLKLKINRLSSFVTYLLFGTYILDIPSGYKAFTSVAYKQLRWQASNYAVELEIAAKTAKYHLPYTTVCIKTIYHDVHKGFSALDLGDMIMHLVKMKLTL